MPHATPELQSRIEPAVALVREGKLDDAARVVAELLAAHPRDATIVLLAAEVAMHRADAADARVHARAAASASDDPVILDGAARILRRLGTPEEVIAICDRALARAGDDPQYHRALLDALHWHGSYARAAEVGSRALDRFPANADFVINTAAAHIALGHADRAESLLRRARATHPTHEGVALLAASVLNSIPAPRDAVFLAHREFGRVLEAHVPDPARPAIADRRPDRPLRVGLLSPDLRRHSVAYFIEPLLGHVDQDKCGIACYHTHDSSDAVSARLRSLARGWRALGPGEDANWIRQIREDRLDILIDLAGLTANNRVHFLAHRLAPVQMTYLGYPNTTGLSRVDHRIVDSITDPPLGSQLGTPPADAFATERLIRIDPCFVCYKPPDDAPPVSPPPCRAAGAVTFGSFNSRSKLCAATLNLWSRVLAAAPGSRLALKTLALEDETVNAELRELFTARGVTPDRILSLPWATTTAEHLASYAAVDIALDTVTYNGTTTTCEALLMGVPVLTLAGDRHSSRVGASLLAAAGLPELVAHTPDEFVTAAATLARDPRRLADMRSWMRRRLLKSSLCDAPAFARRFQSALRAAWHARLRDPAERAAPTLGLSFPP